MTKYSLTHWVVLLTLIPTLVIGTLLSSILSLQRFKEMNDALAEKGASIIEPLAIASEQGVLNRNREQLKRLLSAAHRRHTPDIKSITLFDSAHKLVVSSNYQPLFNKLRLPAGQPFPLFTTHEYHDGSIILRTPVLRESSPLSLVPSNSDLDADVLGYLVLELTEDSALLALHQSSIQSIVIVLMGMALAGFFASRLVKKVTRPISRMVNAVEQIRRGNLESRLTEREIGELDELKNGINAMAKSIDDYHVDMQQSVDQATSDLRQTLEQLEEQNVELGMAKSRAQEAARVKSEFLANMSHELRTPLNGIIGFTRQLAKTTLNTTQTEHLNTIDSSASNLLNLINDILDLSKLEAGKMSFDRAPFTLRDVIDEVMLLLAPTAAEKHIELAVNVSGDIPNHLIGDALRLRQVFINLVGNAIKFTDVGSVLLKVTLVSEERNIITLRSEVQDTGTGISAEMQAELFQAFNQGDSSLNRREGGTGLGLAITKKLIDQMGGEIGVQSQLHKGSNFWCTMTFSVNYEIADEREEEQQLSGKMALVMEPQLHNRQSLQSQLKQWGIASRICTTASEWRAAIEQKRHFDIILLAVDELSTNALQFEINQTLELCDKLVLMGAYSRRSELPPLSAAMRERVSWFSKPLHPTRLANAILYSDSLTAATRQENSEPLPNQRDYQLLAVDDNRANLKLIETLLKERFARVTTASSGKEALNKARNTSFDLIFMDIQMPGMDGVTTSRNIRRLPNNGKTPIVAVTAHAMPQEKEALLKEGLDDYLAKPIQEGELEKVISHWLPTTPAAQKTKLSASRSNRFTSPFINWEAAVSQSNGREELAQQMIEMVLKEVPATSILLAEHWKKGLKREFQAAVHKLHGSACYAGMTRLQSLTNSIETEIKQGAELVELEPEYLELMDILEALEPLATNS